MSEDELSKIYKFLHLDNVDPRVKFKADNMKRVIEFTSKWKRGAKQEWIDKSANRTSISTRKIRENYIDPLITDRILREHGNGNLEFVGLPDESVNSEIPKDSSESPEGETPESFMDYAKSHPHENPEQPEKAKKKKVK